MGYRIWDIGYGRWGSEKKKPGWLGPPGLDVVWGGLDLVCGGADEAVAVSAG
ncbi:MAG: hypothetical protein RI897_2351 [Verrucomicrobiota bacterium]